MVHVCTFFRFKQISGYSVPIGELQRVMCPRVGVVLCKSSMRASFQIQISTGCRRIDSAMCAVCLGDSD